MPNTIPARAPRRSAGRLVLILVAAALAVTACNEGPGPQPPQVHEVRLPSGHGLAEWLTANPGGTLTVAAGHHADVGGVRFTCPAGGADCRLTVAAENGVVRVTSTGGAASAALAPEPVHEVELPSGHGLAEWLMANPGGILTVAAGQQVDAGGVRFTCPAGGADCRLTVAAENGVVRVTSTGGAASAAPQPLAVVTIRGTLEDSETNTGRPGEVRAYRRNEDGSYTLLDSAATDAAGTFALSFQDGAASFDLQARLKDGGVDASYVRTITLPMRSASDLLVRAVPYTGLNGDTMETDISIEQFREFIIEIMDEWDEGIYKWKQGHPKGIEVLHETLPEWVRPGDPGPGVFTQDELDFIEDVLRSDDVRALVGGRDVRIQIDGPSTPEAEKHYHLIPFDGYPDGYPVKDEGWIFIVPYKWQTGEALGAGGPSEVDGERYIVSGAVGLYIDSKEIRRWLTPRPRYFRRLILHELAHVNYAHYGHPFDVMDPGQTITIGGGPDGTCWTLCFADRKALAIAYEDTFPAGARVRDLLGLTWRD